MDARGVMDQMLALSIRYIEANYFQHNIEFSASDVTQAKIIFSCRRGFASMEGESQKASAIGRRKFPRKKENTKMLKRRKREGIGFSVYCGKMCAKAHGFGSLALWLKALNL